MGALLDLPLHANTRRARKCVVHIGFMRLTTVKTSPSRQVRDRSSVRSVVFWTNRGQYTAYLCCGDWHSCGSETIAQLLQPIVQLTNETGPTSAFALCHLSMYPHDSTPV